MQQLLGFQLLLAGPDIVSFLTILSKEAITSRQRKVIQHSCLFARHFARARPGKSTSTTQRLTMNSPIHTGNFSVAAEATVLATSPVATKRGESV